MSDPTPGPDPAPVEPPEDPVPPGPDPARKILPEQPPTEILPDPDRPVKPLDES